MPKNRTELVATAIIISPAFDNRGRRLHGRFVTTLDGRQLCISRQPLLDAARILIGQGANPTDIIAMRHAGSPHDALRSTVGGAAALTVEEGEKVGPRFVRWKAFSRSDVQAPVRSNARPVAGSGPSGERLPDGGAE